MTFYVIGIDDNQQQEFSSEILNIIRTNHIFSGGARHHEIVRNYLPNDNQWIDILVPIDKVFAQYNQHDSIVVFASGDPLFFGFANTIKRMVPDADIILYPYFNSLQLLAHRLVLPYQDMHIVSLTGRPWNKFDEALILGYDKIGILTDKKEHIPSTIIARMLEYGYDNYIAHIGELLGNKEQEKVTTFKNMSEVIGKTFSYPNNLILEKTTTRKRPFGIPETDFYLLNGRAKMITKMPIRLLSLSLLQLRDKAVFWDVGFCTGSVSVEAKLQFPHLDIHAFEKRTEGAELMEQNMKKFGALAINYYIDDFMNVDVTNIPRPDAIFIGGHGGNMEELINKIVSVMTPNGIIVFNSVSESSQQLFLSAVQENNLIVSQSTVIIIDQHNPINVMQATRK